MSIIVGSARIDENGKIAGGTAGDQTGKEVSTQTFYMHSKGWYVLRPKSVDVANKLATAMRQACDNNNIGYDQNERSGVVTNVKKYGSMDKISVKTEADCSSLARACIIQATGKDVGNFNTANEADVLEGSGLFEKRVEVKSSDDVYNGDVMVTKTKGHTVIVVSGRSRQANTNTQPTKPQTSSAAVKATKPADYGPDKAIAGTYVATANVHIRNGAGTSNASMAVIPKGTRCRNYGYYSTSSGTRWLYVEVSINGRTYVGFVSGKYLTKI